MKPENRSDLRGPLLPWLGVFLLVAVGIQWLSSIPWDADTAYHIAVARLIRTHGILHDFPWTPFSWLADHYADKELLFHLLMVPFAHLNWLVVAQVTGILCGFLALCTMFAILRGEGVPAAGLWPLFALASSSAFFMRFALVRPHILAIGLALIITWAASRRSWKILFVVSLLYPWSYTAWSSALVLGVCVEVAYVMAGHRLNWRVPAVIVAGLVTGLLIHPNFPEILRLSWITNVEILFLTSWAARGGFELGREFQPFQAEALLRYALLPWLAWAAAAWMAYRQRKRDPIPLAWVAATTVFVVLTARTSRFIEYLAPFAALSLALAFRSAPRARELAAGLTLGAVLLTATVGRDPILDLTRRGDDIPPFFIAALQKHIPQNAQVFTCDWGLTGSLMIALPERRFIVALDPVLFYKKDPRRYTLWYELVRSASPDAARTVQREFGSDFVLCFVAPDYAPFFGALAADPNVRPLIRNPYWVLYALK